jgi:Na+/proline symporter
MRSPYLLVGRAHAYVTHNTIGHGASNTTWTAVLAGLIPILGIVALGILVYALVKKGDASDEMKGDDEPGPPPDR